MDLERHEMEGEIRNAEERYGPFASTHEGLGVLTEEVCELTEAIRNNDMGNVRMEAIQVAAVALRLAKCCPFPAFQVRSGA